MSERKPIGARAMALMVLLCATWGLQQVVIKATAPAMAPIFQVAVRSGVAAGVMLLLILWRRETPALRPDSWGAGSLVGLLFALEFLCIAQGLTMTSASHLTIFLYTAPIFAALGLHFRIPEERLSPLQWMGIGIAFAGIILSFTGRDAGGASWAGDLLGIAAGACWGATTLAVRFSRLSDAPATVTLFYQLAGAFVVLAPASVVLGQTAIEPTPLLAASLIFQTLIVSVASFLTWFALLRTYLASRLGVLSFMTPVFGIGFGVLLLNERLDAAFIAGAVLILAGILLVGGHDLIGRRSGSRPPTVPK